MVAVNKAKDFKRDGAGHPISGGSKFVGIINQGVSDAAWTAVLMPAGKYCKQMLISERGSGDWKLAVGSEGTAFLTVIGPIGVEVAKGPGERLFYARMVSGSGTIEVLLVD